MTNTVDKLLDMQPDAIPRYILLKEFKQLPDTDTELQNAYDKVLCHPFVQKIVSTQETAGYWGEFHGYTESIIRRCLFIGMNKDHPCLKKTIEYIEAILTGQAIWNQRIEKHDTVRWWLEVFMPLVSASMLSLIDPDNHLLKDMISVWRDFGVSAWEGSQYNSETEKLAQIEHFRFEMKRTIPFYNYYVILLLTSKKGILPEEAADKMLSYCMNRENGIYYVYDKRPNKPVTIDNTKFFYHWLRCSTILSRYSGWLRFENEFENHLMEQRNPDGLWDIRKKPYGSIFPISDSWHKEKNRIIDSSIVVLHSMRNENAAAEDMSIRTIF